MRLNENYRRMRPKSRPLMRSGQWSQTTTTCTNCDSYILRAVVCNSGELLLEACLAKQLVGRTAYWAGSRGAPSGPHLILEVGYAVLEVGLECSKLESYKVFLLYGGV